jgi:hypothetical protein
MLEGLERAREPGAPLIPRTCSLLWAPPDAGTLTSRPSPCSGSLDAPSRGASGSGGPGAPTVARTSGRGPLSAGATGGSAGERGAGGPGAGESRPWPLVGLFRRLGSSTSVDSVASSGGSDTGSPRSPFAAAAAQLGVASGGGIARPSPLGRGAAASRRRDARRDYAKRREERTAAFEAAGWWGVHEALNRKGLLEDARMSLEVAVTRVFDWLRWLVRHVTLSVVTAGGATGGRRGKGPPTSEPPPRLRRRESGPSPDKAAPPPSLQLRRRRRRDEGAAPAAAAAAPGALSPSLSPEPKRPALPARAPSPFGSAQPRPGFLAKGRSLWGRRAAAAEAAEEADGSRSSGGGRGSSGGGSSDGSRGVRLGQRSKSFSGLVGGSPGCAQRPPLTPAQHLPPALACRRPWHRGRGLWASLATRPSLPSGPPPKGAASARLASPNPRKPSPTRCTRGAL